MNHDPFMPLETCGTYSYGDGVSPWIDTTPSSMEALLQGPDAPAFRTALARVADDTYAGPLYIDIDSDDIPEAIDALQQLLQKLEASGLNLEAARLFATGSKGFHLEIPQACFMREPAPVEALPRIYRAMALAVYVDCIDLRVYSSGRGRLWRVPNLERSNGAYKVPLTLPEVRDLDAPAYTALCSAPRHFPALADPVFCPKAAALFETARAEVSAKGTRRKSWSKAEGELQRRFDGGAPPSLQGLLAGNVPSAVGFNVLALQLALTAHALGWTDDRLISEAEGLIRNHASDGGRYNTPRRRASELRRMFHYVEGRTDYSFSVSGLRSVLPPGTPAPDLIGLEADSEGHNYAHCIDSAENPGAVVEIARQIVSDPSLSKTEAENLIKRAAKSAGVATKVLRSDLFTPSDGTPVIDVRRANFAASVDSALAVLPSIPPLRVRSGQLVEVASTGKISPVPVPRLAYLLSSVAHWRYADGMGAPDAAVLQAVLAAGSWPGVPDLLGIATAPSALPDGTIGLAPGFQQNYAVEDFPPYAGSGAEALADLRTLVGEFPFATAIDEASALAAILTAVARPTLRTAPAFLIAAHDYGSGKSYLAELVALFANPEVEMVRWAQRTEEQDKMLLSLLREARPACIFDNLIRDWQSPTLAAILTSPTYNDRLLGSSEAISVSTRTLFIATGNNVRATSDMIRRTITIDLDPKCESPITRIFRHSPVAEVRRDRGRWIMCALQVLQHFLSSAEAPALTPMASFSEWSYLVRGALAWYGLPDPLAGVLQATVEDDEQDLLRFVLETWQEAFGVEMLTLREALQASNTHKDLAALFDEVAGERGEVNARKLGAWFKNHAGRVAGGRRLVAGPKTRSGVAWRVLEV